MARRRTVARAAGPPARPSGTAQAARGPGTTREEAEAFNSEFGYDPKRLLSTSSGFPSGRAAGQLGGGSACARQAKEKEGCAIQSFPISACQAAKPSTVSLAFIQARCLIWEPRPRWSGPSTAAAVHNHVPCSPCASPWDAYSSAGI